MSSDAIMPKFLLSTVLFLEKEKTNILLHLHRPSKIELAVLILYLCFQIWCNPVWNILLQKIQYSHSFRTFHLGFLIYMNKAVDKCLLINGRADSNLKINSFNCTSWCPLIRSNLEMHSWEIHPDVMDHCSKKWFFDISFPPNVKSDAFISATISSLIFSIGPSKRE